MSLIQKRILSTAIGALALGLSLAATAPASAQKLYGATRNSFSAMEMPTIFGHSIQYGAGGDLCGMPNGAEILGGFGSGQATACRR